MNILFISNDTEHVGGWSVYTKTLMHELQHMGHMVTLTKKIGAPLSYYSNPLIAIFMARRVKKYIATVKPDCIHITVEPYSAMLPYLGKKIATKTILTIHGSYGIRMFEGKINAKRSLWILKHIGACICVSEYTKKRVVSMVQERYGQEVALQLSQKILVIKNGVTPPKKISNPTNTIRQILCVGGVKPRKGILESLKAVSQYVKTIDTNIHITIVGSYQSDDAYFETLQSYLYSQSINKFVTFTGIISDKELGDLYKKTDVYLMPAKTTYDAFEGFGIVYIEAAGYGIPCIGTNDSGAAEAIQEGVSGYTCNPEDTNSIVQALDNILNENSISRKNCRIWAEKHSASTVVEKIMTLYRGIESN